MNNFLDLMDSIASIILELKSYRNTNLTPLQAQGLANAQHEGRLHIAPCNNGTKIWYFVDEEVKELFDIGDIQSSTYEHGFTEHWIGELNKDWFLSKEAAKKALKERE